MNSDGSGQTQLTDGPFNHVGPAWSPDGQKILVTEYLFGDGGIWAVNVDGSGETHLTSDVSDSGPTWSPDGQKIAFQSSRNGGNYHVYTANADGSGQTLLSGGFVDDEDPAWSPDGQQIAFESYRMSKSQAQIFVTNADGSGRAKRLTNTTNKSGGNAFADWQPTQAP